MPRESLAMNHRFGLDRAFVAMSVLCIVVCAQTSLVPVNGGTGIDGAFAPAGPMFFSTTTKNLFNYTSINIPAGVTIRYTGANVLILRCQGAVTIDGTIDASGSAGGTSTNNTAGGAGGVGGPGAYNGGAGGTGATGGGTVGAGPGGGVPGTDGGVVGGPFTDPVGGGGGGGNGTVGQSGGAPNSGLTSNASGAGGPTVTPCRGGSGGGGGGNDVDDPSNLALNDGGGGGGGGGGFIVIAADGPITINGFVFAKGGAGGTSAGNGGGGGGGAGGLIQLLAPSVTIGATGSVAATGGAGGGATMFNCGCSPGGAGGDGCVLVATPSPAITGSVLPAPSINGYAVPVTSWNKFATFNVTAQSPSSGYVVAMAFTRLATPIQTGVGGFELDLSDALFQALFPVNTFPAIFTGLSGVGSGTAGISLNSIPLFPGFDMVIHVQVVSTNASGLDGISSVTRTLIEY